MKLTEEQAQEMLKQLRDHYRQPVMPVEKYCEALMTWARVIREAHELDRSQFDWLVGPIGTVFSAISKSNLLHRLIYQGEPLRTKPCPVHLGHWSGCHWDVLPCGCQSGSNITGWLVLWAELRFLRRLRQ